MVARPYRVLLRPRAEADIDAATDYYLAEAGVAVAQQFGEALAGAFVLLGRNPSIGSIRYAEPASMPGLRAWPLRPWPYMVFYVLGERVVDVIRVLHTARDLPTTLAELPDESR